MIYTIVTGAASDIGKTICLELANNGKNVLMLDVDEKSMSEFMSILPNSNRHHCLAVDFLDAECSNKTLINYIKENDIAIDSAVFPIVLFKLLALFSITLRPVSISFISCSVSNIFLTSNMLLIGLLVSCDTVNKKLDFSSLILSNSFLFLFNSYIIFKSGFSIVKNIIKSTYESTAGIINSPGLIFLTTNIINIKAIKATNGMNFLFMIFLTFNNEHIKINTKYKTHAPYNKLTQLPEAYITLLVV